MTKLVIVESPTKAKTISKFLGEDFQVESSFGHVRDLPKSVLGIDVENNFQPKYLVPAKAKKTVSYLKSLASKSDFVMLATDEDREGEAIAWHLLESLHLKKEDTKRVVFHEITKSAIDYAIKNPRTLDMNMVDAQQARRVLDRIVGYKLSPFLWKKVARGLSAGRVQSVALRLIVERENEIRNFKSEEYWSVAALLQIPNTKSQIPKIIESFLVKIDDKPLDKFEIKNKEQADKIISELEKSKYKVVSITKKEIKRNPLPPFTTSTLQQEASKKLGFSAKRTMLLAQRLYENGHITYMRTDSVNLSKESTSAVKNWLNKELGEKYASQAPRFFETKSKMAQEAHEAIRPTDVTQTPETIKLEDLSAQRIYKIIWQRFVASQMPQAIFDSTTIEIKANRYIFRASGNILKFDGYLKIWPQKFAEKELPEIKNNEELELKELKPEQHFTEPPPRYSEATLIKTLEDCGIGRPSTYAPTISVIQDREYVQKDQPGGGGRFLPTPIGEVVNKVLTENFPEVVDINFTANMENSLDAVAEGKEKWQDLIGSFYTPFIKNLENKYQEVGYQKIDKPEPEKTNEVCEKCGKPMVIRTGRFGKFMACSGFPECKNTKRIISDPKLIGMKCPKCNEGDIVERFTRKGRSRIFWGCSLYPKCDYATWTKPVIIPPEHSEVKEK